MRSKQSLVSVTAIERGQADYGVVPIENSTDGGITDTIDAFLATLRIINELTLRIRHHLMARCPLSIKFNESTASTPPLVNAAIGWRITAPAWQLN